MTHFTLNTKAQELAASAKASQAALTLQAPAKGLGMGWRNAKHTAPNTRAHALAVLPEQFTLEQAVALLDAARKEGLNLGSGTPRSYCKAFVVNGYFVSLDIAVPVAELEAPKAKRKAAK